MVLTEVSTWRFRQVAGLSHGPHSGEHAHWGRPRHDCHHQLLSMPATLFSPPPRTVNSPEATYLFRQYHVINQFLTEWSHQNLRNKALHFGQEPLLAGFRSEDKKYLRLVSFFLFRPRHFLQQKARQLTPSDITKYETVR